MIRAGGVGKQENKWKFQGRTEENMLVTEEREGGGCGRGMGSLSGCCFGMFNRGV